MSSGVKGKIVLNAGEAPKCNPSLPLERLLTVYPAASKALTRYLRVF